jgi:hypothetical protein
MATNLQATTEELLKTVFSTRSVPRCLHPGESGAESPSVKRRLGGWCEITGSLGIKSVEAMSQVVDYYLAGNGMSTNTDESLLLKALASERIVKSVTVCNGEL